MSFDGFTSGPVRVSVPATSANLGPGFDCMGLALSLGDTLEAEVVASGLSIEVVGEGSRFVPRDERHLVVRTMREAFAQMGVTPPGLRLSCRNVIPHSRGLGSSSAAIVGGITLACALVESSRRLDEQQRLVMADRLEGHPDNAAPALLGGFTLAWHGSTGVRARQLPIHPGWRFVAYIPPSGVATKLARGLLPATVSHADAAANSARSALLVAGLALGDPELVLTGTEDFLHQQYRRSAMPESLALVESLRAQGVAAVISGAGPTVLAITLDPALAPAGPAGWARRVLSADHSGAQVS